METTLLDLRNLWMKRLMFYACVQCSCDKLCDLHQVKICNDIRCMHFLNLDECLTNNVLLKHLVLNIIVIFCLCYVILFFFASRLLPVTTDE